MSIIAVSLTILRPGATVPAYQSEGAAGMDLAASLEGPVTISPGGTRLIPCGIAIAVPPGFEAQVRPRSGLAAKYGVTVLNAPGTIDSDYRGEVKVILINHGNDAFTVEPGSRVAQLIVAPVARVTWHETKTLPSTERGDGGFGHTGH